MLQINCVKHIRTHSTHAHSYVRLNVLKGNWEDHFNASSNNFHDTWAITKQTYSTSLFDSLFKHKTAHRFIVYRDAAPKYTTFNTENQFGRSMVSADDFELILVMPL